MTAAVREPVRADIQGLRALAVSAVVVYHLWPGALPGGFTGVDVFFVVSGFLITGRILRDLERPGVRAGRFAANFWAARARRILPAGLLVLAVVLIASRLLLPTSAWAEVARHSLASALSVENWVLAGDAVDYLAADNAPTPLQHYWSLSVEEQFYLGWPLLLLVAVLLGRRTGRRWPLVATMGVVVVGSLVYALVVTSSDPASAYFVTPARVWQLGAGGLLALLAVRGAGPGLPRVPWLGLALIVLGFLVIEPGTPYPGTAALLPTLGTCLVLVGGRTGPRSVDALADVVPVQRLGDISYSLYLWHWPLIVLAPYAVDRELTGWENLPLLLVALVLSGLTYVYVENPARRGRLLRTAPRSLLVGAVAIAVVAGGTVVLDRTATDRVRAAAAASAERAAEPGSCFGAEALKDGCADPFAAVDPAVGLAAAEDEPSPLRPPACTNSTGNFSERTCTYGSPAADRTLVLWGDSHAAAWADAFDLAGRELGWKVVLVSRQACPASLVSPPGTQYHAVGEGQRAGCAQRNAWVVRTWLPRADAVVLAGYTTVYDFAGSDPAAGFVAAARAVRKAGAGLLWLADLPLTGTATERRDIPECLERDGQCTNPVGRALATSAVLDAVRAAVPDLAVLDARSRFCDQARCYGAVGGVAVYFDASHLTRSYARSLGPWLTEQLQGQLGR